MMPGETFYLAAEFRQRYPGQSDSWGKAGQELETLSSSHPAEMSWKRLSEDFGVPHPALAQNYSRELLNLKPFPAFMGYSSRLLAESWDSNNLYWARLADETGLCARDAEPPDSRADAPDGGENLCYRLRRLAGDAPRNAGDG